MRTENEIKALFEKILKRVSAPDAQISYAYRRSIATRFGENSITQNMGGANEHIRLEVAFGTRQGSYISNSTDDTAIDRLVKIAESIAKISPENPEYMPPVEPQTYLKIPERFCKKAESITPEEIANDIAKVVEFAKSTDYKASGLFEISVSQSAMMNSKGLFAFEKSTGIDYSTTIHGPKGSGFASENNEFYKNIDVERMARKAHETAVSAQDPKDIEPGDYTVIFEPQAVFDLLEFFGWDMGARDADEGTTAFAGKIGEKLFSDKINIYTDPTDPEIPGSIFGEDGLATRKIEWVKDGVLVRLNHNRFWAKQKGTDPDPALFPIHITGENNTLQDLISQCKKGLLLKRLWYIRYVDRKEFLLTGMTRDGFFLIEDGKIAHPVKNLRFNESPIVFLKNVVALGKSERVGSWAKVPPMMSENFTFSSKTESL